MELKILIQEIDSLKNQIDKLRPINPELEKRIMQKFRFDWNYHSNSIEGNQLTYGETKVLLLNNLTAKGKPLKDHLDIQGHNEALLMLEDIVKENRIITENFIRELHVIILKKSYTAKSKTNDGQIVERKIEIGKYKSQPNHIETLTGEIHYFATPEETPVKMYDLLNWYRKTQNDSLVHPLITASVFHHKFIEIHPFDDGNGRLSRILMNLILMQSGYPPVIIKTEKKADYYNTIQQADGGNETLFIEYIGEQLVDSLKLFLKGANGENIDDITDVDKKIEFLKTSLNGETEKQTIDKKQFDEIYQKTVRPLLLKVLTKLEKFDELFFSKEIICWKFGGGNPVKSIDEFLVKLDSEIQKSNTTVGEVGFNYNFKEFRKTEIINFDTDIDLKIIFIRYNYLSIYSKPETFSKIHIPYSNPIISQDDEILIINSLAQYIIDQISAKMKENQNTL
jgi:Fic family protein